MSDQTDPPSADPINGIRNAKGIPRPGLEPSVIRASILTRETIAECDHWLVVYDRRHVCVAVTSRTPSPLC